MDQVLDPKLLCSKCNKPALKDAVSTRHMPGGIFHKKCMALLMLPFEGEPQIVHIPKWKSKTPSGSKVVKIFDYSCTIKVARPDTKEVIYKEKLI